MITTAVKLKSANELTKKKAERVEVTCGANGQLQALSWLYTTDDSGLNGMVKRLGGVWDRAAGSWMFPDWESAQKMFDAIVKRHPDWPVSGHPDKPFLPLDGISISRLKLADGFEAALTPASLPFFAHIAGTAQAFHLASGKGKGEIGLLLGSSDEIDIAIDSMIKVGSQFGCRPYPDVALNSPPCLAC